MNTIAMLLLLLLASTASAAIVEHTFDVGQKTFRKVCSDEFKVVVNGNLPGPTIDVREGDTLIVHVNNNSPYNVTIHWHGVYQLFSNWADGPAYVTQCPIAPKSSFTQRFRVTGQEGTLWWHAHYSTLRDTVYGALVIRPRLGRSYPFPRPYGEIPILLGEWYNANSVELEEEMLANGKGAALPDARTINGQPGVLYPCSEGIFKMKVVQGKTYLLRMVNADSDDHLFFKLAGHTFTVVAVDARYTQPYKTDIIVMTPGQSADVLFTADQPRGSYYMASSPYAPTTVISFSNGIATAIVEYEGSLSTKPLMPALPDVRDTKTAHRFLSNLTSLTTKNNPHWIPVPKIVDERMFITLSMGLEACGRNNTCANSVGSQYRFSASMNNVSFQAPTGTSMLEAYYHGIRGVYTEDFPDRPPVEFDYTDPHLGISLPHPDLTATLLPLVMLEKKETRIKRLKFNSVVEIVLQNTALLAAENHPMHFHGFDFYILAQGFGNYDPINDPKKFNLVNPQERNTIGVPVNGWAVIRFRANNPGMWLVHCHRETHVPWGLDMAFLVENGPTSATSLPPPPVAVPEFRLRGSAKKISLEKNRQKNASK